MFGFHFVTLARARVEIPDAFGARAILTHHDFGGVGIKNQLALARRQRARHRRIRRRIFRISVATAHAIAAVMTRRAVFRILVLQRFGQQRLARRNHPKHFGIKLVAALLNFVARAIPLERFLIDAIGYVGMLVGAARHAHHPFHPVVMRREVFILDRPRSEIVSAVAPTQARPQQRLAAYGLAQKVVEALVIALLGERLFRAVNLQMLARIPALAVLRQFIRHRMAIKFLLRLDPLARFEYDDRSAAFRELHGDDASSRARTDDTYVIDGRVSLHDVFPC